MNKALFSSILGSETFTKSRLPELMFSGHLTIQYMFCMYLMIKKIILEGFNDRGEGNLRGKRGKYFEIQKVRKNTSKLRRILAISRRILDENPPYFACGDFLTCSIDPEWSQGLGSLKMKV